MLSFCWQQWSLCRFSITCNPSYDWSLFLPSKQSSNCTTVTGASEVRWSMPYLSVAVPANLNWFKSNRPLRGTLISLYNKCLLPSQFASSWAVQVCWELHLLPLDSLEPSDFSYHFSFKIYVHLKEGSGADGLDALKNKPQLHSMVAKSLCQNASGKNYIIFTGPSITSLNLFEEFEKQGVYWVTHWVLMATDLGASCHWI